MDLFAAHTSIVLMLLMSAFVLALTVLAVGARVDRRRQETHFKAIYDSIAEGIYRSTLDGRLLSANPALVRMNGFETEVELLEAVKDISTEWYVDPNRREEFRQAMERDGHVRNFVSEVYRHKTREKIWISENARLVKAGDGVKVTHYEGTIREVTDQVRRSHAEERLTMLAELAPGCLYQFKVDEEGNQTFPFISPQFYDLFPTVTEDATDKPAAVFDAVHPTDLDGLQDSITQSMKTGETWEHDFRVETQNGYQWVHGHSVPRYEENGSVVWYGFMTEISARKEKETRAFDMAFVDPLTRLPNRRLLEDRLEQALLASDRSKRNGAVFFIDLDNFKTLNDTEGHAVGDKLLIEVASRLTAAVRKSDTVARMGGDEFVILVEDLEQSRVAAELRAGVMATRILQSLGEPYDFDGVSFRTTPSIGVAMYQGIETSAEEVVVNADTAMYAAKRAGRNAIRMFDPDMQRNLQDTLQLIDDLRQAIERDALALHYQPVISKAGGHIGVEALLRWDHPTRGPINPRHFIELARQYGLLTELNDWVVDRAILTLNRWKDIEELKDLRLFVNVSPSRFLQGGFAENLIGKIMKMGVPTGRLVLEVTEAVMTRNSPQTFELMNALQMTGVTFCLDDFGVGYSSMAQLGELPLSYLKIDPTIVKDLADGNKGQSTVDMILAMAESLGIDAIAEGVETEEERQALIERDCDLFQGHLFSEAIPENELRAYLGADAPIRIAS